MDLSHPLWLAHDTQLIVCCLLAIVAIIVLISVCKLTPFLSILIGTFIAGIIIALGAMLGALMAESGAADQIAATLLRHAKGRALPWVVEPAELGALFSAKVPTRPDVNQLLRCPC